MASKDGWPTTDDEREDLLREAEASGLTIRGFARHIGISPHTLYSWRSRLRRRRDQACEDSVELIELDLEDVVRPSKPAPPLAELVLGPGITVRVPSGFDPQELEDLLRVVLRAC